MSGDKFNILYIVFLLPLFAFENSIVQHYEQGLTAYQNNQYELAIQNFEQILSKDWESSTLYYNLGNAYYKSEMLGQAIWAYEKGLQLEPNDNDLRHNLIFVKRKAGIAELPKPVYLIRLYNSLKSILLPLQL